MLNKIFSDYNSPIGETFDTKEKDIIEKNRKFFSSNDKYSKTFLKIIKGESSISIRVLDWFVANYSKKNNTFYKIKIYDKIELFYVNNQYKNKLNGYSKQYFDPFCRKKKIAFSYCPTTAIGTESKKKIYIESSIGQLNFFQWAIRNKVILYVRKHLDEIETDMRETSRINKANKIEALKKYESDKLIDDSESDDDPDPIICSSDTIKSINISPKKSNKGKSDSDSKCKRQQLSRSVYEYGIKKSNIPIRLEFE